MSLNQPISILAMDGFFDAVLNKLSPSFKVYYQKDLPNVSSDIQGIIATPWTKVSTELIKSLPNLKIISCFGVGVDNVDKCAAMNNKIFVTNTPDVVTEDTADIGITLLLCLARNIVSNDKFVRSGGWQKKPIPLGTSIFGKTLGIIGLGKIGKRVAKKAENFGLQIVYHSRTKKNVPYHFYNNLIEMAQVTHFLIVCCPGGNETKNIINSDVLQALGNKGCLINISRGSTVNEKDLIVALESGIILGAGLDVYADEPNVPEQLMKLENVVLLPHIGTATRETRKKMLELVIENINTFFMTGEPLTPIGL